MGGEGKGPRGAARAPAGMIYGAVSNWSGISWELMQRLGAPPQRGPAGPGVGRAGGAEKESFGMYLCRFGSTLALGLHYPSF